jgi:hypothetical protein
MSMHPARQAYVEEETRGDAMEGIDYASVRTSFSVSRYTSVHACVWTTCAC